MSELKACPLCKSTDVRIDGDHRRYVVCSCGAAGPYVETEEEAIELWNHRPLEHAAYIRGMERAKILAHSRLEEYQIDKNVFGISAIMQIKSDIESEISKAKEAGNG